MRISRIKLRNWKNFKDAEVSGLPDIVYVIGANASGKSNFLDALNFLKDVANPRGGGLQQAVYKRGGMGKIRYLHAKSNTDVVIEVDLAGEDGNLLWTYSLSFNSRKGSEKPFVLKESVTKHYRNSPSRIICNRSFNKKNRVPRDFFQTGMEQSSCSKKFNSLVDFLSEIKYFYIIPQFIKLGNQANGNPLEEDPFGQDFINYMYHGDPKSKRAKIKRITNSLKSLVPQLEGFNLTMDKFSGQPHLEIKLRCHKHHGAIQREDQLSDGTIRLIAMMWVCYGISGYSAIIEEPELSLNDGVVQDLCEFFEKSLEQSKKGGQLFVSTHNGALLSNPGISSDGVIVIKPSSDGSTVEKMNRQELMVVDAGFPPSDAVLPSVEKMGKVNLGL